MGNMKIKLLWFLIGLGSQLQVVASLSVTELIVLIIAPLIIFKEIREMKRDGVITFFFLSILLNIGCLISCVANKTEFAWAIRGLAATVLISCSIVVGHWILRKDMMGFRWMILGGFFSGFICLFIFQKQVEVTMLGGSAEEIMRGPIFWISRLKPIIMLPVAGWYLNTPTVYSIIAPLGLALFSVATSTSGRSVALAMVAASCLVIIGRKKRRTIALISRKFFLLCVVGLVGVAIITQLYGFAARHLLFSEEFTEKYEHQTEQGSSALRLLLTGRAEAFAGLYACIDKPIVGWGPWAMDSEGYYERYLKNYGNLDDYMRYLTIRRNDLIVSIRELPSIPVHSHVTQFWVWFGLIGLLFVGYIFFVIVRFVKQDVAAVPQWFGWLMCSVPSLLWSLLFSAFTSRFGLPLYVVAFLMARAIRNGKIRLPDTMLREIERAERK